MACSCGAKTPQKAGHTFWCEVRFDQKPNYIELPLDPEFVTPDGAYMAGYIWGQHVRSEKDARQMFPGDSDLHENFYKGVLDGYNDKMNEMMDKMNPTTVVEPKPVPRKGFKEYIENLDKPPKFDPFDNWG